MNLTGRLDRLEEAERRRLVGLYAGHGLSNAELDACLRLHRLSFRQTPPIPVAGGKVDVEPTMRALAGRLDLDPDELLAEAERIAAEMEFSNAPQP